MSLSTYLPTFLSPYPSTYLLICVSPTLPTSLSPYLSPPTSHLRQQLRRRYQLLVLAVPLPLQVLLVEIHVHNALVDLNHTVLQPGVDPLSVCVCMCVC